MKLDFLTILIAIGIVQGFFLSILLFSIKKNKRANTILGVMILLASTAAVSLFFYRTLLFLEFPHLSKIGNPIIFLITPLTLFYTYSIISEGKQFHGIYLLHFIPFVLCMIYLMPFFLKNGSTKIEIIRSETSLFETIIILFQILHILTYAVIGFIKIKKYQAKIKNIYSKIECIGLDWLKRLYVSFIILLILYFFMWAGGTTFIGHRPFSPDFHYLGAAFTLFLFIFAYWGITQPEILTQDIHAQLIKKNGIQLDADKIKVYLNRLKKIMEEAKPYVDNDLTIHDLAKISAIPTYYLSKIINQQLNKSFYDYINFYRIQEAKKRLIQPTYDHYTILAIALDCGFNSKSAFNVAFKKFTKTTPSRFKKQHAVK